MTTEDTENTEAVKISVRSVNSVVNPLMPIKAEKVLAELNRLRTDLEKDPQDMEWFALHHAFCFISYKMGEFQKYLNETVKDGEFPED